MKKAVVLRVAAVSAAAVLGLAGCTPGADGNGNNGNAPDEIRVGFVFPTSGSFSALGTDQANGVRLAIDWANENGGINGVPIRIIEGDTQSDPGVGATVAQRLIDQDDVDILIGSFSSGISQSILPVAQRNNVVFWEVGAVSPTINADGNTNFIRTVGGAETYAQADIDFIENFIAPKLGKDPADVRIAVGHEDGAFGTSVADAIVDLAGKNGLNVVLRDSWSATTTDMTPFVLRVADAKPDVLLMTPIVADTFLFWEAARTQNLQLPAVIGSSGFSSSTFPERFGAAGIEGVFDVEAPAVEYMSSEGLQPEVRELLDGWREQFKADYGHECLVHCGDGLGGGYILVSDVLPRALEKFGNADAESIIAAAAETNIPEGGTPQGFGAHFVKAGTAVTGGDNDGARSYIMQWRDGKLKVVWPEAFAVDDPVFPMPTWDER
jgi:branched-chain amino acid transport system substrate-binding protein